MFIFYIRFCLLYFLLHILFLYSIFLYNKIKLNTLLVTDLPIQYIIKNKYQNYFIHTEDICFTDYQNKKHIFLEKKPIIIINNYVLYTSSIGIQDSYLSTKYKNPQYNVYYVLSEIPISSFTKYHIECIHQTIKKYHKKYGNIIHMKILKATPQEIHFSLKNNDRYTVNFLQNSSKEEIL